jgi:hypothetical protein
MAERAHGLIGLRKEAASDPDLSAQRCYGCNLVVFGLVVHAAVITTEGGHNIP